MKIKGKTILSIIIVALIAATWGIRYTSLNSYYSSVSNNSRKVHPLGEIVSFDDNYMNKGLCVPGYSIRVNKFEICHFDDYVEYLSLDPNELFSKPDRVALVHVTLFNQNSTADGVMLTEFKLHGLDNYVGLDWDLLSVANPVLQDSYGISLSQGTQYDLVLPFDLYQDHFGTDTWKSIDKYHFFLHITAYPVEKDIQVQ